MLVLKVTIKGLTSGSTITGFKVALSLVSSSVGNFPLPNLIPFGCCNDCSIISLFYNTNQAKHIKLLKNTCTHKIV